MKANRHGCNIYIKAGGCCMQAREAMLTAMKDIVEDKEYREFKNRIMVNARHLRASTKGFAKCLGMVSMEVI